MTTNLDDEALWRQEIKLEDLHWINDPSEDDKTYQVRLRYRGPLVACTIKEHKLSLDQPQRTLAAGQSAVLYDSDRVVGGGIIA